jgi:arginine utilization protein RocB
MQSLTPATISFGEWGEDIHNWVIALYKVSRYVLSKIG